MLLGHMTNVSIQKTIITKNWIKIIANNTLLILVNNYTTQLIIKTLCNILTCIKNIMS